jgi:lysozyme
MRISDDGMDFLIQEEGVVLHPYKDSAGVPTIGIGSTVYPNGNHVTMSDPPITLEYAKEICEFHLQKRVYPHVQKVTIPLKQNQIDALCSFIYNIGGQSFDSSTLLKKINSGAPCSEITAQFLRWKNAGGQPILLARRKRESALYCN